MEGFFNTLITLFKPPWNYVIAGFALAILIGPRLAELPGLYYQISSRRWVSVYEKERLELLKLRYEIEALKKQHDLPELESPALTEETLAQPEKPIAPPARSIPIWLSHHPRIGRMVLLIAQALTGSFVLIFGISVIAAPLVLINKAETDMWMLLFLPLTYLVLTLISYMAFRRVRRLKARIS
jgi:hypothetical protein